MKKIAFAALAGALVLVACDNTPNDDTAAADTATTADGTDTTVVVPGPTATETTVVTTPGTTATTSGDQVSVGPNGVTADVGDGDTRVRVETRDPTITVKKN